MSILSCSRKTRSRNSIEVVSEEAKWSSANSTGLVWSRRKRELGKSAKVESLDEVLEQDLDLKFVKGGASTRMNKTNVSVIDIGTIRHGHRDGIFSEWHSTYYMTDDAWLFQLTRVLLQLTRVTLSSFRFFFLTQECFMVFPSSI